MRLMLVDVLLLAMLTGEMPTAAAQQNLPVPEASPGATVTQTVGTTDIILRYHRPGVKGRTIWGGLVPYDEVWRAGANENTTISFSGPVRFAGKELPAGTYGLHMIPTRGEMTVILSTNATSWGSFFYRQDEDALRVAVKPQPAPFQEWLSYQFNDLTTNAATLSLRWEELEIPVVVEVDVPVSVVTHAREVYLRGLAGFSWQGWYQAAHYCAINNVNLKEAISWTDRSIRMNRNFNNLWVKGVLLDKTGKTIEGKKAKQDALALADEAAINVMGYQHLTGGDLEGAVELFSINVQRYPNSWNVYDSLGEGYAAAGKTTLAVENYMKALTMVSDETQKDRIRQVLKTLGAK